MCTFYLSAYGYVWTRIHTYKNCQHGHIWEAHCGAEKKWRLLLSFHREMVIRKMFLLLLSEEDRRGSGRKGVVLSPLLVFNTWWRGVGEECYQKLWKEI